MKNETIYLSSKYPIGSVITDYDPDSDICQECMEVALRVEKTVKELLAKIEDK